MHAAQNDSLRRTLPIIILLPLLLLLLPHGYTSNIIWSAKKWNETGNILFFMSIYVVRINIHVYLLCIIFGLPIGYIIFYLPLTNSPFRRAAHGGKHVCAHTYLLSIIAAARAFDYYYEATGRWYRGHTVNTRYTHRTHARSPLIHTQKHDPTTTGNSGGAANVRLSIPPAIFVDVNTAAAAATGLSSSLGRFAKDNWKARSRALA